MKFKISSIQARDLVNAGTLLDAQDPGLKIKIGKYEFNTDRQTDAGINADFNEKYDMIIDDDDYDLNRLQIEVEALNVSLVGVSTSLGKGSIPIKSAVPRINKPNVFSIELTYFSKKGNYRKGVIHMEGLLQKEGAKVVLDDLKKNTIKMYPLKIQLQNFKANNLVDTGGILDVQDPCLKIKLGNKEYLTERQQDAGTDADFQERFEFEISRDEYNTGIEIEIEALNVSKIGSQTHIGKSSISLKAAVPRLNKSVMVEMDLTHYSKKGSYQQGVIIFEAKIITNEKESIFVSMYNTISDMFSCCFGEDNTTTIVYEPTYMNQSSNNNTTDSLYHKSRKSSISNAQSMSSPKQQSSSSSSGTNNSNKSNHNGKNNTNVISEAFFSPLHAVTNIVGLTSDEPELEPEPEPEPLRKSSIFGFQTNKIDTSSPGDKNNNNKRNNPNKNQNNKNQKESDNNDKKTTNNNNTMFFNFDDVLSDVLGESEQEKAKRKNNNYSSPNETKLSNKRSSIFGSFNNNDSEDLANNYSESISPSSKKKGIVKNVGKVLGMNTKKGFSKLNGEY